MKKRRRKHGKGIATGKRADIPYSVSFLQMRKPRLSELKEHFQGHTATKEKRLDLNLRLHVSKAMSLAVAHVLAGGVGGNPSSSPTALISISFFLSYR